MKVLNHTVLLLVVSLLLLCCRGDKKQDTDKKKTTFKATQEWQTVQEGDILPSGLHYRMNLETGKKEAKLIDMNDNNDNDSGKTSALMYDETKQEVNIEDKIAESIRKINDDIPSVRTLDPATESEIKQFIKDGKKKEEFRNYEELKSIFDEMNITVETDSDILNKLLATFNLPANTEEEDINMESDVINYLKDFEYLVSQIDNARHFVSKNGITQIILPCLNSSNFEIKTEALKLLGSAVQNNIPVQIKALEQNILQPILHLFDQHVISKEHIKAGNELDHVYRLKSAAIYAISCLVRNFPIAQNALIQNGGLNILLNEKIFVNNCENGYKLQLKIASLITTLLQERYDAEINFNIQRSKLEELDPSFFSHHESAAANSSTPRESAAHSSYEYNITLSKYLEARSKLDQYNERNLGQSLSNLQWCNIAKTLFIKNNYKTNMETVTNILLTNLNLCDNFRRDKQLRNILVKIHDSFGEYEEGAELNLIQLYDVLVEGEGKRSNVKEEERGKTKYEKDEL